MCLSVRCRSNLVDISQSALIYKQPENEDSRDHRSCTHVFRNSSQRNQSVLSLEKKIYFILDSASAYFLCFAIWLYGFFDRL